MFSLPHRSFFRKVFRRPLSNLQYDDIRICNPPVNPNYLVDPFDLSLHVNATKISRQIFSTPPLSDLVAAELLPGLLVVPQNASDTVWKAFVESSVTSVLHPVGTVPMLPQEDGGSVDERLKVYGTANVRVVGTCIALFWFVGVLDGELMPYVGTKTRRPFPYRSAHI